GGVDSGGIGGGARSDDQALEYFGRLAHVRAAKLALWGSGKLSVVSCQQPNNGQRKTSDHGPQMIVSRNTPRPAQMPRPPLMLLFTFAGVLKRSPALPTLVS